MLYSIGQMYGTLNRVYRVFWTPKIDVAQIQNPDHLFKIIFIRKDRVALKRYRRVTKRIAMHSSFELCTSSVTILSNTFLNRMPMEGLMSQKKLICHTGKSLSEALIFASTNPQYDYRLFIELRVQYMKIASSEHVVHTNCFLF